MKKLLAFSFFSVCLLTTRAQEKFVPEWTFGIGVGPTFSSMSFEPRVSTKSYLQYNGGVSARYISDKNLGVIGELNLSQQGWQKDFKEDTQFEHKHSLTYLELPLLTHIYFGNKTRFFVNLGPKIQLLLTEKMTINDALREELKSESPSSNLHPLVQYSDKVKNNFDYGLTFGLGVEQRTKFGHFSLEGRYYFGLGDVFDNHKAQDALTRSANRVMSLRLTYYTQLLK